MPPFTKHRVGEGRTQAIDSEGIPLPVNHLVAKFNKKSGWRIEGENGAAVLLGINPGSLRARMRKYVIHRQSKKISRMTKPQPVPLYLAATSNLTVSGAGLSSFLPPLNLFSFGQPNPCTHCIRTLGCLNRCCISG